MGNPAPSFKGDRYPVEVISHCVWLCFRFPLSFREVEELRLERGVIVSYENVRRWCVKFGQQYANSLRRRRPRLGNKWHLDEVLVKINGEPRADAAGSALRADGATSKHAHTPPPTPRGQGHGNIAG
jgi:putative transposase